MVFLCNPNNPTCRLTNLETIESIANVCRAKNVRLVIDECFIDFTEGYSAKVLLSEYKNIIILKAFTKIFSMAGLRLGYLICSDLDTVMRIKKRGQSWSVSSPAQIAGIAALKVKDYPEKTREFIKTEREWLIPKLEALPIKIYPSDGNFILFKSIEGLWEKMMDKGIMLRSCANFHGLDGRYYRIGIKKRKDNELLIKALSEVLR
jgi:threonine-phosphate decarboxylase